MYNLKLLLVRRFRTEAQNDMGLHEIANVHKLSGENWKWKFNERQVIVTNSKLYRLYCIIITNINRYVAAEKNRIPHK